MEQLLFSPQADFPAPIRTDFSNGALGDESRIARSTKTLGELANVFADESAFRSMNPATAVYAVEYWKPVTEGTEGGLYWGNSTVFPGRVGEEFFMTRGHFHARRDRAEYYAVVSGSGLLVLMTEQRQGSVQHMLSGTTHYIPGFTAHRVVNTGDVPLRFLACWPSDAGYDYRTIEEQGFSMRVLRRNGRPEIVEQP